MENYLNPTYFLDFDNREVGEFVQKNSSPGQTDKENAVQLYYAVRDGFKYNPYVLDLRKTGPKASSLLKKRSGYCVEKAVLLAASGRAVGIPSRLSFYIVANHIATEKIERILKTNQLVFHGAAEFYLDGRWLKVTPAFDARLCRRLGVAGLDFDGEADAIFQQYDENGNVFMEYLHDYGSFDDMPYELALKELKEHYPHIFDRKEYLADDLLYDLAKREGASAEA